MCNKWCNQLVAFSYIVMHLVKQECHLIKNIIIVILDSNIIITLISFYTYNKSNITWQYLFRVIKG
jgi:hypothetical protein